MTEQLQQSKFRDERLDTFRGLAMIWVVFNHCLYWMNFFPGTLFKSYLLIGTQLFFVIAGASNGMSEKKTLWKFYYIRFKRILFPYWLYAVLCLIITYFTVTQSFNIWKAFTNWFLYFEQNPCKPGILMWALWFVPVYLLVMAIFPFLRLYYERNSKILLQILPFLFFIIVLLLAQFKIIPLSRKPLYYTKMTAFYGFFAYVGLFFTTLMQRSKTQLRNAAMVVVCCAVVVIAAIVCFDVSPNMQKNKFPPTVIFLIFTLGVLSLLYIFSNHIIQAVNFCRRNPVFAWIYRQYTKHGLTIFLFHPFVFLLLIEIQKIITGFGFGKSSWLAFLFIVLLAIPLAACVGYLFAWVEKLAQINKKIGF